MTLHWHRPEWLITGLVLLVPAAWFIVARHRAALANIGAGARRVLSVCRVGVLLLLVLVLGGPYARMEQSRRRLPVLIVLVDESASMSLKAGPWSEAEAMRWAVATGVGEGSGGAKPQAAEVKKVMDEVTRIDLVERVMKKSGDAVFAPLRKRFDLYSYRFAQSARNIDLAAKAEPLAPGAADETALGAALQRAIDYASGRPIAGIMVISDGSWTTGSDPLTVVQPARSKTGSNAGENNGLKGESPTPVFAIPVGSATPVTDIAVLDVLAPRIVAKGDVAAVIATIGSAGFEGKSVAVRLLDRDRELDKAAVTLRDNQPQQAQLSLRDTDAVGPRLLRIAVDEQPGEAVKANNQRAVHVRIDGDRLRVLYLEAAPRWDYRFLDHALRRDKGVDVSIIMEGQFLAADVKPADLPAAAKLPRDAAAFAEYALVMLGDISPDLLPARLQEQLAVAVKEKGVGLIVQAGTQSMPQRFAAGPLGDLLPVTVAPPAAWRIDGAGADEEPMDGLEAPTFAPFHMKVTAAGAIHPAFQLYDSATKSRAVWSAMPPFYWAAAAIEAKPAATVLAEAAMLDRPVPLIAEQFAGRGRVMFIGTDSTYLWRRNIGDQFFYRFWGQAIRHVARRQGADGSTSRLEVRPAQAEPGDAVTIELFAADATGKAIADASAAITAARGDATPPQIIALDSAGQPGYYRASWRPEHVGDYQLSFSGAAPEKPATASLRVAASGRELLRPSVDRAFLGNLADFTGGAMLELDELAKLVDLLPRRPIENVRPVEEDLWDNWLTLVLLVGLYCVDVGVRRMAGVL